MTFQPPLRFVCHSGKYISYTDIGHISVIEGICKIIEHQLNGSVDKIRFGIGGG